MSATVLRLVTRPPAPLPSALYWTQIKRRSSGPCRTFWIDACEVGYGERVKDREFPQFQFWNAEILRQVAECAAQCLPSSVAGAPIELQSKRHYAYHDNGRIHDLCVVQGRYRLEISLPNDQPPEIQALLRTLPVAEDSWTPADESKMLAEKERQRVLNEKLGKLRRLLRERPEAWPTVEATIDRLCGEASQ
jgi:hypothetical protein